MKNKYICIHGHFYQPPRENPWLDEIEREPSAEPDHDWNARIERECYRPNTVSRSKDHKNRILNIQNNFAWISFNIGPTLIDWMARHAPETLWRIQEADRESCARWGHGNALAQVYNHIIMPLATRRDKVTQVAWGIAHFEQHFGRFPEGMWLAETAVDTESLETLAEAGIRFTVLSPQQARRFREAGEPRWTDCAGGKIDPTRPYHCPLPSGRSMNIFFYDGPISRAVAFEHLLTDGVRLARRIFGGFWDQRPWTQLVSLATDGESYGHHSQFGDMALARALQEIRDSSDAQLTNFAAFLKLAPPAAEVEIIEPSAWSCSHGVGRWNDDCGCKLGNDPGWHQQWRRPLRDALNKIKTQFDDIFETQGKALWDDPWAARNHYIHVLLNRANAQAKTTGHATTAAAAPMATGSAMSTSSTACAAGFDFAPEQRERVFTLLEMQRNSLLMFTSCGWFFDDISRIEPVQNLQYAARALQLARRLGTDCEAEFIAALAGAKSNFAALGDGAAIYRKFVAPRILELEHLLAHRALLLAQSRLSRPGGTSAGEAQFVEHEYCYRFEAAGVRELAVGACRAIAGELRCRCQLTCAEKCAFFAVIARPGRELACALRDHSPDEQPAHPGGALLRSLSAAPADEARILQADGWRMFGAQELFQDSRRSLLRGSLDEIGATFEIFCRQIEKSHGKYWTQFRNAGLRLPRRLNVLFEARFQRQLAEALGEPEFSDLLPQAQAVLREAREFGVELDLFALRERIYAELRAYCAALENTAETGLLERAVELTGWTRKWLGSGANFDLDPFQDWYFRRFLSGARAGAESKVPGAVSAAREKNDLQKLRDWGIVLDFHDCLLERLPVCAEK